MFVIIALFPNSPINFFLCEHVTPVSLTFDDCHDDCENCLPFLKNNPVCPLSQRGIYNSMCIDCLTECVVSSYIWFLPFFLWVSSEAAQGWPAAQLPASSYFLYSICVCGRKDRGFDVMADYLPVLVLSTRLLMVYPCSGTDVACTLKMIWYIFIFGRQYYIGFYLKALIHCSLSNMILFHILTLSLHWVRLNK